jgi:hypothetical protein
MSNSVLHDRLQDQCGNGCRQDGRVDVEYGAEPLSEPALLDFQVARNEVNFHTDSYFRRIARIKGGAEELANLRDHRSRCTRPARCH